MQGLAWEPPFLWRSQLRLQSHTTIDMCVIEVAVLLTTCMPPPLPPLPPTHTHTLFVRSTMSQAGDSDGKVIQRLNDNEGAFARLTPDAVATQLPRLQVRLRTKGGVSGKERAPVC